MVTLSSADKVLKNVYLDAICDQLNNKTNPFYAAIEKCADNVSGKMVEYSAKYGINGGMGSGTENGSLPVSAGNYYQSLTAPLRNLYGTITLSDKVLRAGRDSAGAVVDILNQEIEGLLDAAKFNFSRMLWQNGNGTLAKIGNLGTHTAFHYYPVQSVENLMEGMM
ncbi:MAG: phage major capsid protein, partial [Clostridia bacterium]|nr:phage major capsid protein [Clostridia bacterium]